MIRRLVKKRTLVTSKAPTLVIEDIGELGYFLIGYWQRIVRISGMYSRVR